MSVWPKAVPAASLLSGSEGTLVSVSIPVDPCKLETLLEILAQVDFPINPQIYHQPESHTLVEFPAWAGHLDEVRGALTKAGFPVDAVRVTSMLDLIEQG